MAKTDAKIDLDSLNIEELIALRERIGEKIDGIAVHIGARVLAHAAPNEVLVSSTVRDLVAGSELCFVDRGTHVLDREKGIDLRHGSTLAWARRSGDIPERSPMQTPFCVYGRSGYHHRLIRGWRTRTSETSAMFGSTSS